MDKVRIEAKFIGVDNSMGFKHGVVYEIETYVESKCFRTDGFLWLKDKNSDLKCPYKNMENLMDNWLIKLK